MVKELQTQIAQLRHAYSQLVAGRVVDQKKFAHGLIAPAIRVLEDVIVNQSCAPEWQHMGPDGVWHDNPETHVDGHRARGIPVRIKPGTQGWDSG